MESIRHGSIFHFHSEEHPEDPHLLHPPTGIKLRTMSKSDPHIDIPHLTVSQDETHPSLNKMMANLVHVHEGLRTPTMSHPNLQELRNDHHLNLLGNSRNSSAALLHTESVPQQPTLRKSSSSIDWNGAVAEATRKASRQFDWNGLQEKHRQPSFTQVGSILAKSKPADEHSSGLVMHSLDHKTASSGTMSMMSSSSGRNDSNPFAQASSASATIGPMSIPPIDQHHGPTGERPHGSGVFGGVFQRGFFSKPVIRTDEENYRYIMALDR